MKQTRVVLGIVLFAFVLGSDAGAWDWPSEEPRIASVFGQYVMRRYQPGIVFDMTVGPNWTPAESERVYSRGEVEPLARVPSAIGDFCLSRHDDGFLFVVATLSAGSYLAIVDTGLRRWVNPVGLLPDLSDGAVPRAEPPTLRGPAGVFPSGVTEVIPAGTYDILVSAFDVLRLSGRSVSVAPHSVFVRVAKQRDDVAVSQPPLADLVLVFDVISFEGGLPSVGFLRPHRTAGLYQDNGVYNLGSYEFTPGRYAIDLAVEDASGNRFLRSFAVGVVEPGDS